MSTKNVQSGDVIDHLAGAAYASGAVVVMGGVAGQSCTVGIAQKAIASGDIGPVAITKVHDIAKVSGAVIIQGQLVDWDSSESEVDDHLATSATGDVPGFGMAAESAGNGVTTIAVLLLPGNGVLNA